MILRHLAACLALLALLPLGAAACGEAPEPRGPRQGGPDDAPPAIDMDAVENVRAGFKVFTRRGCVGCHEVKSDRALAGPSLAGVGGRLDAEALRVWIKDPKAKKPDTKMPAWSPKAPALELEQLIAYLLSLKSDPEPETAAQEGGTKVHIDLRDPGVIARGERLFKVRGCAGCHQVEGFVATHGPNLKGIGGRLEAEELRVWIRDPRAKKPDTLMPAWSGDAGSLEAVLAYLLTLR